MHINPHRHFELEINLPVDIAIMKFSENVEPKKKFLSNKNYVGTLTKGNFEIVRNVGYMNSFLPSIKGSIMQNENESKLSCVMEGNIAITLVFTAAGAFFGFVATTSNSVSLAFVSIATVAGAMLGFGFYLFNFWSQLAIDRRNIKDIFVRKEKAP